MNLAGLSNLVGAIYDSAFDPNGWNAALELMADELKADSTAFLVEVQESEPLAINYVNRVSQETLADYHQHYSQRDPRMKAIMRRGPGLVASSEMLMPSSEFNRTDVYHEFFVPADRPFVLGGLLYLEPSRFGMFVANRRHRRVDFGQEEIELLEFCFPHLKRAVELMVQYNQVQTEKGALISCLDRLTLGVLLADSRGEIVRINQAAREILAEGDGLTVIRRRLVAVDSNQTSQLHEMIGRAARTTLHRSVSPGGTMAVRRPSLLRPLSVLVSPLPVNEYLLVPERPAVAIFIGDPERNVESPESCLSRLYRLTPAESRLASKVMQGVSLREAADQLKVTYETARSQLKSVFLKTETSRQTELIRLLLRSTAALDFGHETSTESPKGELSTLS